MRVYCLFDRVALRRFGALVVDYSDAPVIRMFHEALKDPNSLGRHPADYELRFIGVVSEELCELEGRPMETVATGAAWLESQNPAVPLSLEA